MARSDVLVTTDWAESNLDAPNTVFVEVDEDTSAYEGGHISGAVRLDWKTELQDQVKRDFVDQQQFSKLLSDKGIGNDDTVILYGGNNNWFAAYAYWYFKLYGHENVKLLDGGRKKWELESRELTDEAPSREKTSYTAQEQDTSIRAFRDETVEAIGVKNLVDVRSPDEYAGRLLAPAHPAGAGPARRPRADLDQRPVVQGGQRRRHLQVRRRAPRDLRRGRPRRLQGDHRPVPHRRALLAHLVRAQGAPRPPEREELRRLVDRVRLAGRRPGGPRRRAGRSLMCGAKEGGLSLDGVNVAKEAVIQGQVLRGEEPVANAYVRLLDRTGEFTAEVPTSATGHFRFFAGDGEWTLRTLAPKAQPVDTRVVAATGSVAEVQVLVSA